MRDNVRAVRQRLGRNIKSVRLLRRLSQEQLAERVGNTWKHIGQVERGEVNVTVDILTAIAAGLSVTVAELFSPAPKHRVYMVTDRQLDALERAAHVIHEVKHAGTRRARNKRG